MWWRFLLPALAMTAALIVLFAGVMGELKSWPDLSARAIAIIRGIEARHAPPPGALAASTPAVAEVRPRPLSSRGERRETEDPWPVALRLRPVSGAGLCPRARDDKTCTALRRW